MKSAASRKSISSPDWEDGRSLPVSLAGPIPVRSGPDRVPASRSALREGGAVFATLGIYGPTRIDSFAEGGPLSSWESRLRERLAMLGSTEYRLIWRKKTTPRGRSISRLAASTRRTSAIDFTGWPSPRAHAAGPDYAKRQRSSTGMELAAVAGELNGWSTPSASEGRRGGTGITERMSGTSLRQQVAAVLAGYPTPTERDYRLPNSAESQARRNARSKRGQQLPIRAAILAAGTSGSSSARTKKASTGALSPEFVCWLMGFPPAFLSCAPSATPSSRGSRRK